MVERSHHGEAIEHIQSGPVFTWGNGTDTALYNWPSSTGCEPSMALRAQTQLMLAGFLRFADHLERASSGLVSGVSVSDDALREAALSSLRSWRDHPDEDRSAIAIVIAAEWLQQMGLLVSDLEAPVDQAVEAARLPWWRS